MRKIMLVRWAFFIGGMMILSLGISMTIKGQRLGIGPWDVLHVGLYENFGLTIGTWGIITGFIIIISTAVVLKKLPQIGTWINMILIGLFIDMFNWLLPEFHSLEGQVTIFILGIVVVGYGIGLYVSPNMGAGPRDGLMLLMVDKLGISLKMSRTLMEVGVACLGWLLGGPVGVGTVLIALLMGQFVHYTLPLSRKLLLKIIGEADQEVLFEMNLVEKVEM
ncbi:YczE/YyaS/YitT family protein [Sporosarcina sp. G11-34]|uniref:YczE/YyaS/YitT family protein n=1 Tax=Sporosarcina sp. G11-34 TaxID=2849605 RepID=UPI0022A9E867|nr:YitT family protein [Sporosarcina sp. G11-34]MCZ2257467.1 YitT family protein [Sporosarcina sp. G11-34]